MKDVNVGDQVGIGWYIDACLNCETCSKGDEVNCLNRKTETAGAQKPQETILARVFDLDSLEDRVKTNKSSKGLPLKVENYKMVGI